ncbi:response regulator [Ruminococcus sp. 5_1_39BFAA]|uniref:response regulator n=1 Tax=Ruminococcus sp. 5_1_39BFAA TaxID=457412 RepID=UPI0035688C01
MKTVMLVDDERPARELLKMTIDWEKTGFKIIYEARNGRQALEYYSVKQPDLIITDVQMPVMDGLEFLEQVKTICPTQKVVILSCHENFSYAKQALKLGVMDYLIKDALTGEVLYNLLEGLNKLDDPDDSQNHLLSSSNSKILTKALSAIPSEQQEAVHLLDSNTAKGEEFFCCTCCMEGFSCLPSEWDILAEELQSCLNESGKGEASVYHGHYLLILCFMKHQNSQMELFNNRFQSLLLIRKRLELLTGCSITIGVSSQSRHSERLQQLINESYQAFKSKIFQGTGKNLFYNPQYNRNQKFQIDTLNSQFQQIRSSLEKRDKDTILSTLSQIYGKCLDGIMHYHYLSYVNAVLLEILMENCQKRNVSYETVFGTETLSFDVFDKMNTPDSVLQWFQNCFSRLVEASDMDAPSYSVRIRNILHYIKNNYQQDISLETVADTFWLHKVYLAKIFKQETGKSVNEYIRNVRIEKAKELLLKDYIKINEIVTATGFNNPQSFYTIFKKYVGMTPGEYRDQMLNP